MMFFALRVTRNGQKLWEGPFRDRAAAWGSLDQTMYCTGKRVVTDGVPPDDEENDADTEKR